jgi:hypothetical protein
MMSKKSLSMKSCFMILAAMAAFQAMPAVAHATPQPAQATGNEGGPGNGGDGLELSDGNGSGDTILVPVPGELTQYGELTVKGVPGADQEDKLKIAKCKTDANGLPVKLGCGKDAEYHLNEAIKLAPGFYRINYSNTFATATVRVYGTSVLELKKLQVASAERHIEYQVIADMTDLAMRDRVANRTFCDSGQEATAVFFNRRSDQRCESVFNDLDDQAACMAWRGEDYRNLLHSNALDFSRDGDVRYTGSFDGYEAQRTMISTMIVSNPQAGEFVSVFPGTYEILFKDTQGTVVTQHGIHVE